MDGIRGERTGANRTAWFAGRVAAIAVGMLCVIAVTAASPGGAQEKLPTVQQVLDKYVAALGGKAAIQKTKSRITTGTFEIPEDGTRGTVTFYAKAPNKRRYTIDVPGFGQIDQCFDGTTGWASNPQMGVRDLSAAELAQERISADFYSPLNIATAFTGLAVRGRERMGEQETIVLEGKESTGGPRVMYFDAATGLLIRVTVVRESEGSPVTVENYLEDYREVDGVKVAHRLIQVQPQFRIVTQVTEVKNNAPVDDAVFARPGM